MSAAPAATGHHARAHAGRFFRRRLLRALAVVSGIYALYSGLVLIASTGIVLAPLMHHVLHLFHAEQDESRRN